jgi:hypothetical protein
MDQRIHPSSVRTDAGRARKRWWGSEAAQDGDDLAEDGHVVGVELHR